MDIRKRIECAGCQYKTDCAHYSPLLPSSPKELFTMIGESLMMFSAYVVVSIWAFFTDLTAWSEE